MRPATIHELVLSGAPRWAEQPVFRHIFAGKVRQFYYGDLPRLTYLFAQALSLHGAQRGDRIIICADNSPEWVLCCLAALRLGLTVVPVDARSRQTDIETIAEKVKPCLFVLGNSQHALLSQWLDTTKVVLLDTLLLDAAQPEQRVSRLEFSPVDPQTPALIVFTSGTSGTSKGVVLTHANIVSNVTGVVSRFRVSPRDKLLSVLPLSHMFEYTAGLISPLASGACIVYCRLRGPEHLKEVLKIEKISVLIGVPAIYQNLLKGIKSRVAQLPAPMRAHVQLAQGLTRERATSAAGRAMLAELHKELGGQINFWAAGGAPVPAELVEELASFGIPLLAGYGLTEASPVVATNSKDDNLPGSVGKPLPGVCVRIENSDASAPEAAADGEVVVAGPNVMAEYLGDEQASMAVLRDGWLHTGDLGHLDECGRLFITGRSKSTIVTGGGYNIHPEELEQALELSPHIKEACVFGLPSASGEQAFALILPADESSGKDKLFFKDEIARCLADMAEYKRLSGFELANETLPRTRTGKVRRGKVAEIYLALQAAAGEHQPQQPDWDETGARICAVLSQLIELRQVNAHCLPQIRPRSTITGDLGVDSFARLELGLRLAEAFAVEIPDDTLNDAQTVEDLIAVVHAQRAKSGSNGERTGGGAGGLPGRLDECYRRLAERSDNTPRSQRINVSSEPWPYDTRQGQPHNRQDAPAVVAARRSLVAALKLALHLYNDFEVDGAELVNVQPPFLVAANHSSHVDTAALFASFPQRLVSKLHPVAAADTFFAGPISSVVAANILNAVPFDRYGDFEASMAECIEILRRGEILIMFPEGTRSLDDQMGTFHNGPARLAMQAGCPVVPAFIDGAHAVMPKHALFPKPGKLRVTFGMPLLPPNQGTSDFAQLNQFTQQIQAAVLELAQKDSAP